MPSIVSLLQEKIDNNRFFNSQHHAAGVRYANGKHFFIGVNGDHGGCHSSMHAEQNALRLLFANLRQWDLCDLLNDKSHWAIVRENPAMVDRLSKVAGPEV